MSHTTNSTGARAESAPWRAAPDCSWLAATCPERSPWLWDLSTGASRHDVAGHPRSIIALAAAPHGDWLAAAGFDGTITVWRPDDQYLIAAMRVDATLTTCIALPDGAGITRGRTGGATCTFDRAGLDASGSPAR